MKKFLILSLSLLSLSILSAQAQSTSGFYDFSAKGKQEVSRVTRSLNNPYVYKGEWITGLTVSYLTLSADDSDFMLFLDGVDADLAMTTVKPYFGYFYKDNRAVGLRLGYSYISGTLNSSRIDLGESSGIQIDIPYIHGSGCYYSGAVFHRSYTALDRRGHFGLFADVELGATTGYSIFEYGEGDDYKYTKSNKTSAYLSFNPGLSVFLMRNISTTVSFEFGGLHYTHIKQYDENGILTGSRDYSGMSFKFNFLAINFGVTYHIW